MKPFQVSIGRIENEKKVCNQIIEDIALSQKKAKMNESPLKNFPNVYKWGAKIESFNSVNRGINENNIFLEEALKEENSNSNFKNVIQEYG
jgi:hypothetical protein